MIVRSLILLVLCCLVLPPVFGQGEEAEAEQKLPVYQCKRVNREITLSGKMDDPLWEQANTLELVDSATGIRKGFQTTVRMLWSRRYLYVGFQCEDDYIWGTYTKRDEPIYREEVVEIFLSPTGKIRQYYEIEVSPLNTVLDSFVLNGKPEKGRSWNNFHPFFEYDLNGMKTRVHVEGEMNKPGAGKGWSVEMAIPFTGLIGNDNFLPVPGETWRCNLFRLDVPAAEQAGQYAWSPMMMTGDFHRPWLFGELVFQQ